MNTYTYYTIPIVSGLIDLLAMVSVYTHTYSYVYVYVYVYHHHHHHHHPTTEISLHKVYFYNVPNISIFIMFPISLLFTLNPGCFI